MGTPTDSKIKQSRQARQNFDQGVFVIPRDESGWHEDLLNALLHACKQMGGMEHIQQVLDQKRATDLQRAVAT